MTERTSPSRRGGSGRRALVLAALVLWLCQLVASTAIAAPEARLLRVDPRASTESGTPVLTTVVELVQPKRLSDAIGECAGLTGTGQLDCMSEALEKDGALYTPFNPFPQANAIFTVTVDGIDQPAKFVSTASWGQSQTQPSVGTAWLLLVDADRRMGASFADAKATAAAFVAALGPSDIVNIVFLSDRQSFVRDSKWIAASDKARATAFINGVTDTFPNNSRNRPLASIIRAAATDAFKSLGNIGESVKVPLHQAMVVLSNGYGGADPLTNGAGGLEISKYMTKGRFPEDNTALPKSPLPVISVYYPSTVIDEYRLASLEFMQNMANTEIGGFFTVMRPGQAGRAPNIVRVVRTRFSKMHIVRWRVACIAPSVTQTFKLVFNNVKPAILGDNSFENVPVGIDPTTWPLDVNVQYTAEMAQRDGGVHPKGRFKVYGDFCWGGDKSRAEAYFVPAGQQLPGSLAGADVDKAKRTQQQLIAMGMKGTAVETSNAFVEIEAPDKDKILHGAGDQAQVRVVIVDNKAARTSGVTADSILTLKGRAAPFPLLEALLGVFGLLVIVLLVVVIVRGGGKKKGGPPPPPVAAPPYGGPPGAGPPGGYGAPPGGYGGPPYGGGPGVRSVASGLLGGAPAPALTPALAGGGTLPPELLFGGRAPRVALTDEQPARVRPAPPDPYGGARAVARARLEGEAGTLHVAPGVDATVGSDPARSLLVLAAPGVEPLHATFALRGPELLVRDEGTTLGTSVDGTPIAPRTWVRVPHGAQVTVGRAALTARFE
ncbi:MAG: FHA domain-containing protein [Polyangiaceae bacterium]|nr:FHA domain-containing protein [Polyangiaceae bacterium]